MKTATYNLIGGGTKTIEYDKKDPCIICGEPVTEASMGGTVICPWCDCGKCRFCGKSYLTGKERTREECEQVIREHIRKCKEAKMIKLFPELTKEEYNELVTSKMTYDKLAKEYPQPKWCGYPDALYGTMGCWSLLSFMVTSEDFCKDCDCYTGSN